MRKQVSRWISLLCAAALMLALAPAALAAPDGWQNEDGGWRYYAGGAPLKGVRWIEAEGARYIFDADSGLLLTGDAEGDVLFNNNLYHINPGKNTADPKSCFAVRNYTRNRGADVGITYYDSDGITFVGWISAGGDKLMYQTRIEKERVPGAAKDIYIYVWRAQYIKEGSNPLTGAPIPAGWYLFGDDGVLITADGNYTTRDGHAYTVSGGRIATADGQPVTAPAPRPAEPAPSNPSGIWNIDNVPEPYAIEADVVLTGTGSGYQAKLVFVSPSSGATFGPQFDTGARAPYTNRNVLLAENILHNGAGGQDYQWPGSASGIDVPLGQPIHLMLGLGYDGTWRAYYNGAVVGTYNNPNLTSQAIRSQSAEPLLKARVEVSAKHEGDSVNATFTNIKVKNVNESVRFWGLVPVPSCPTITPSVMAGEYNKNIQISGALTGIGGADWDSAYDAVSGIMEFEIWFPIP